MIAHLKPQIRDIGVANFGNSPAIARNLRLDVTNLGFNLPHPELIEVPLRTAAIDAIKRLLHDNRHHCRYHRRLVRHMVFIAKNQL